MPITVLAMVRLLYFWRVSDCHDGIFAGYGHATRVSAFTCHLLRLEPKPIVHIISSAPKHVFADSVALGGMSPRSN